MVRPLIVNRLHVMTLLFSHGVLYVSHKMHKIHRSAHALLVLYLRTSTLGTADSESEPIRHVS